MNAKAAVAPIPAGYHSLTPYLIVDDATAAIAFYRDAFGAEELMRLPMGEKIGHAELRIGDSILMLSDEWPETGMLSPRQRGGATSSCLLYLEDVDAAFERAVAAGASIERAIQTEFWGDRMGSVIDPFGHRWSLASHVEDVPEDELQQRMQAWSASAQVS